ncbi:MAG: hypothetical protein OXF20_11315 [Gammaproteobacteria bacterium]|nr:hypothetical protein [Gammaproteobacteria bacterium]
MMEIAVADWITMAGVVGILGFLWQINRDVRKDIGDLRERMAKLEGLFEGFTGRTNSQ